MAIGDSSDGRGLAAEDALSDATAKYVNNLFRRWMKVCRKQHRHIEEMDKFVLGDQWLPQDRAKLNAENRPTGVFNYTQRHINVVSGVQILNNLSPQYFPRVIEFDKARRFAELASGVHDFVMQCCNGFEEIAQAFRDLCTGGIGFVRERLDLIAEPGGRIVWERVKGTHLVWDGDARKQNLEDARGIIFFSKIPKSEAKNEWPEYADYIDSPEATEYDDIFGRSAKVEQVVAPPYDPLNKYDTDAIDSADRNYVILKEAYWYEDENWVEYIDPFQPNAGMQQMKAGEFRKFRKEFEEVFPEKQVDFAPIVKRVYKRAFVIGRKTMEESDAPCQTHFPILAMTGDWNESEKIWTGLTSILKDPQQFLNKYVSQAMHSIATSPKGILLFVDGAFDNVMMAEEQWASWAPFIAMSKGALGDQMGHGKMYDYIPPQQPPQILMEFWKEITQVMVQVSGISQEMLTGGEGEVPGITMRQRQNVAMIGMAGYFNAYRRFLKMEARITLDQARKFYSNDRVITIGGVYDGQAVNLAEWREDMDCQYIVVIDDHPYNANTQMAYWEALVQSGILPGLFKTGAIMQMPSLVDAFPLWSKPKAEMRAWVMRNAQMLQPGQIPGQKPPKQGSARDNPQMIAAMVQHRQAQTKLAQSKTVETLAKARELDSRAKSHQLQAMLDVFAQSYEQQLREREHALTSKKAHHDMSLGMLDGIVSMMGAMNSGQGGPPPA